MKKSSILSKTIGEMFYSQLIWATYYFIAILIIFIVLNIIFHVNNLEETTGSFFTYSSDTTKIFMLILGIIAPSFLSYFISNGVTRKNIFYGSALAAGILSATLVIITGILSVIVSSSIHVMNLPIATDSFLSNGGTVRNMFLVLLIYGLYLFVYYLIGWFIGAGFYKCGWLIGIVFIVGAIILVELVGWLGLSLLSWNDAIGDFFILDLVRNIPMFDVFRLDRIFSLATELPALVSIAGVLGISALLLWSIRQLTKNIAIDL